MQSLKPRGRGLGRITSATDEVGAMTLVAGAGASGGEARTQGRCRVEVEGRVARAGEAAGDARAQGKLRVGWQIIFTSSKCMTRAPTHYLENVSII